MTESPIRVVILDDYEVVVWGLAHMIEPFRDRIEVVELDVNAPPSVDADIVLYDTFAAAQGEHLDLDAVLDDCRASQVVVYTWNLNAALVESALHRGVSGYLSKQLSGEDLVAALEQIHAGHQVVSPEPSGGSAEEPAGGDWPGRSEGLSEREAEVLALIVQGLNNEQVASRAFLSINTVKSYIRSAYRKMGVESRSQAVLWGIDHGFRQQRVRITGGPADDSL